MVQKLEAQCASRRAVAEGVFQQVGNDFSHHGIGCRAGGLGPGRPLVWAMPWPVLQGCRGRSPLDQRIEQIRDGQVRSIHGNGWQQQRCGCISLQPELAPADPVQ